MPTKSAAAPQDILLFGGLGDLAQKKLWPALWNLYEKGLLPEGRIIAAGLTAPGDANFLATVEQSIKASSTATFNADHFRAFTQRLAYVATPRGDLAPMKTLRTQNRALAYMAVGSNQYVNIAQALQRFGMVKGTSIVIEKPIGHDLASAEAIENDLHRIFAENDILRIDHYLGKETVQNILTFREANPRMIESTLHRTSVECVEITMAEPLGVGDRTAFYDGVGAGRDVAQNHLMEILATIAMELPKSLRPSDVRAARASLLNHVTVHPQSVIRAQYEAGTIDGKAVPGYLQEPGVPAGSQTETYFAARASVDTERWGGTSRGATRFVLRTLKRAECHLTEVALTYRRSALRTMGEHGIESVPRELLVFEIQPDQQVYPRWNVKRPGDPLRIEPATFPFKWDQGFADDPSREAYETLLGEALVRNRSHMVHDGEVTGSWKAIGPALAHRTPILGYPAGTWGPKEADGLLPRGITWHNGGATPVKPAVGLTV